MSFWVNCGAILMAAGILSGLTAAAIIVRTSSVLDVRYALEDKVDAVLARFVAPFFVSFAAIFAWITETLESRLLKSSERSADPLWSRGANQMALIAVLIVLVAGASVVMLSAMLVGGQVASWCWPDQAGASLVSIMPWRAGDPIEKVRAWQRFAFHCVIVSLVAELLRRTFLGVRPLLPTTWRAVCFGLIASLAIVGLVNRLY